MLLGEFRCSTDGEGRVTIPLELSGELAEGATVTRGIDKCLLVYPATEWHALAEKIRVLPLTSQPARSFARFIFSGAEICNPDQTGHLPLSDQLRQYAEIDGEVIVVGLVSHLELWSPRRWEETRDSFVDEGVGLAEKLREFAI